MLKIKEYVKAESLEQAYELNQKKTNCVIGGMLWLKMVTRNVQKAIDLSGLGIIPLDQFAANKYPNDILVRLIIKKHPQESVYLSHRNTKTDFPVLTCAVSLGEKEAYAVVGARPSRACRVRLSDQWMEQIKDDEGRKKLADEVTGQMNFGSNMRGSAAYREQLSKVLLRRGFEQLEERREK